MCTAGASAVTGWTVTLRLPSGTTITNIWNGANTGVNGSIPVRNMPYNRAVGAGASTSFGFQANGSATGTTVSCTAT